MKYNFNNDKGTPEVFGFSEGDESWEIRQNGTDLVGWKSDDFSSGWSNDFEARYPEDNTDITNLQELSTWLVSTNTEAATNEELSSPVIYDGVQYTIDNVEYRLAKFKAELPDHADVEAIIFYYLFTEIFLCIDQREKNAFPTLFSKFGKWLIFFYDADSSLGIDNKGKLAFDPYLEDIDYTAGGDPVYNGQGSVLFVNLRKVFYKEIMEMYQQFRVDGLISYDFVNRKFEEHQGKWCEAIFNEDMYRKCLIPMIIDKDSQYLPMLLGKKEMQRKWWLYNRFRFLDSKYITGSSMSTRIMIRAKSKANIWLTSYINMYGHVYYNDEMVEHRMERGKSYEYVWSASGAEDAVIGINDADMLVSLGDLSSLQVETIDISPAIHLTSLKIGDVSSNYNNKNLTSVTFGNNILLQSIDLRNCSALNTSINISGCTNVEYVYCEGTSITGINLPNGGVLKTLHLPDTITNLTIRNQPYLNDFVLNDSANITTLRLENVGALIDVPSVINGISDGGRIRIIGAEWSIGTVSELEALFTKIYKMRGLDESGNNTNQAVITGYVKVGESVSDDTLNDIYDHFPDLVIDDGREDLYIIKYKDWDGKILYSTRLAKGANAIDPTKEGKPPISTPTRPSGTDYAYVFKGWDILPTNVNKNYIITAQYYTKYAIKFKVDDETVYTQYVNVGEAAIDPVASGKLDEPTKTGTDDLHYKFSGWDNLPTNVQGITTVYAQFVNVYPVRFYTDSDMATLHHVQWVVSGKNATDPVISGECVKPTKTGTSDLRYSFAKWNKIPTNVTAITKVYAIYTNIWAVRFYNDDALVNTQWIENGKSAVDPVSTGLIETPKRTSTAQYDYTFSGWEGTYTNITAATTIKAKYTSTVRKYNVYFYNGDTLLQTVENVQYGSSTSYTGSTPVKTGVDNPEEYEFKRFNPEPTNITGETKCYALFKFTGYIKDSWTTIGENAANGTASSIYQIGARKEIPITLSDGTTTIADVEIIAFNHDNLADETGKAAITFFCKDLPNILRGMNSVSNADGGWQSSEIRTFTNGELMDAFPSELKSLIKPVYKISDGGAGNKALITTIDSCWLASYDEVAFTSNSNSLSGQGEAYSSVFYGDKESRKKYIVDDTETGGWWLRSTYYTTSTNTMFWRVQKSGSSYGDIQTGLFYEAFGFCI